MNGHNFIRHPEHTIIQQGNIKTIGILPKRVNTRVEIN